MRRGCVFLDRDGTIIHDPGYLDDPAGVVILPGAAEALRRLSKAGFMLAVITNQSGIGRGYFTADTVRRIHERMIELFDKEGVKFDDIRICPHAPEEKCGCRKPEPAMIGDSLRDLDAEPALSAMVGDKPSDAEAGRNAGCALNIVVGPDASACGEGCARAKNLSDAADMIISSLAGKLKG